VKILKIWKTSDIFKVENIGYMLRMYIIDIYTVSRKKEANSFLGITLTLVDAVP